jgi:potassium efflux system protein
MTILDRIKALHVSVFLLSLLSSAPLTAQERSGSVQSQAPAAQSAAPPAASAAPAQGAAPGSQAAVQGPPVTVEQLESLRDDLRAGKERLEPLMKAVDVSAAESWLMASPLENLKQRAAQAGLADAERASWQQALEYEQAATERVRAALARADLALAGKDRLDEAERQVEQMLARSSKPRGEEDARTLSEIEQDIASLNSRRAQVALELNQRRETLTQLEEQLRAQAETLDQLRRDRDKEVAATGTQQSQEPAQAEAQRAARDALDRRTEGRIIAAQLDSQTLPPRIERLRLEIRERELEGRWLSAQLAREQAEFGERSTEELRGFTSDLAALIELGPDIQDRFATAIAALRRQIDEIADTQGRIRELQQQREEYLSTEADLTQTLADVKERLDVGGLTETLGGLFLEEQRRLKSLGDEQFVLRGLEREVAQSRLRSITLREQLRATPAPDASIAGDAALTALRQLQNRIAEALVHTEESLTDQLRQTEIPLRAVVALVGQLDQILRETLLWWPSHVPVSLTWIADIPTAVMELLDPKSWQEIRSAFIQVTVGSPVSSTFTLLLVVLLFRAGRHTGRHLRVLAEKTQHRFTDNIGLTLKAMGWSLLRVLPGPVLLATTSYRLTQIPETGPGVETLASVLFSAAIWWLAGHLLVLFISRNGVGTVHFEWNPCMVQRLRRNLAWYLPFQFMLIIFLALVFGHPNDLVFDVMGRAALVVSGATAGFLAWRLLAPSPELARSLSERKRRFLRLVSVAYAAALVGLALAGYLLTVRELFARTIDTVVVIIVVWLGYRLAARALILSEMRLRIRRMLDQRAKAAAAAQEGGTSVGEGAVEIPEPHLSMEDINLQTRTLVRVLAGGVMVLALFWVWSEILPALVWLDGVTLWSRTIMIGDTEMASRVSLQDGLLAVFLVGLFSIAARNLPGLVEIILTRTTDMDGAARYTVSTVLRYVIMVAAVISVFSLLGLRWSELQWMVAALTLGLGFGLQEVVANFVSGLIILFERPARVGDTITIGDYSGTVARIRTRATTIIDWDNREIVVPNKMFITDRLINWTLSDTMTRVIIHVGVSYSADVDLVMKTLKEVAEQHPLVMAEPPPTVLFMQFGDSALNFELRVYVNQLRERWELTSDLHRAIIRAFREHDIEIAFPQMDLHVRDLPGTEQRPSGTVPAPAAGSIA